MAGPEKHEDRTAGRSHQWLPAGLRWPQRCIRRISASRVKRRTFRESRMGIVNARAAGSSSVCGGRAAQGAVTTEIRQPLPVPSMTEHLG